MDSKYPLSQEKIDEYQKNGFVKIEKLLSPEEVDELKELTDAAIETDVLDRSKKQQEGYTAVFLQKVNMWRASEAFRKFTLSKRIADVAARLMGEQKVRIWHDHLMIKLPEKTSKATDWHQDFPYWPMEKEAGSAMSVWIPMQDVTVENGCMWFVPGSHKLGLSEVIQLGTDGEEDILKVAEKRGFKDLQKVPVPLEKGDVTFHCGLTFHYAGPNKSDDRRRVLSVIYAPDRTIYNGNGHMVTDGLGLKAGEVMAGEMFPEFERIG